MDLYIGNSDLFYLALCYFLERFHNLPALVFMVFKGLSLASKYIHGVEQSVCCQLSWGEKCGLDHLFTNDGA